MILQEKSVKEVCESQKTFQTFPPEALVRKIASELPEGVDLTQKEVGVFVFAC